MVLKTKTFFAYKAEKIDELVNDFSMKHDVKYMHSVPTDNGFQRVLMYEDNKSEQVLVDEWKTCNKCYDRVKTSHYDTCKKCGNSDKAAMLDETRDEWLRKRNERGQT